MSGSRCNALRGAGRAVPVDLAAKLAQVAKADEKELRRLLSKIAGPQLPLTVPIEIQRLFAAYRLQAKCFGDLDLTSIAKLERIDRDRRKRRAEGGFIPKAVPPVPPPLITAGRAAGTILQRTYRGEVHTVVAEAGGYRWKDCAYGSLSEIARHITGTRWSGPRFFGVASSSSGEACP